MSGFSRREMERGGWRVNPDGTMAPPSHKRRQAREQKERESQAPAVEPLKTIGTSGWPVGIGAVDPGVGDATGLAYLEVATGEIHTDAIDTRKRGPNGPDLGRRLAAIAKGVGDFLASEDQVAARDCNAALLSDCPTRVNIEGAYFAGWKTPRPEDIVKYGMAVGAAVAGVASEVFLEPVLREPDWTWEILTGRRRGGADKKDRWGAARHVFSALELPLTGEQWAGMKEHERDAATMIAAEIAESRSVEIVGSAVVVRCPRPWMGSARGV